MKFSKCSAGCMLALLSSLAFSANADVVVVMSAKGGPDSLSAAQVSQIFLAKSNSLPGGGAAVPIDQEEGVAVRDEFYKKVASRDSAQLKSYWSQLMFTGKAQRPKRVSGDDAVKKAVTATPGAIGYISAAAVDASVKVVLKP
ncbi:phosphate ABC transporter substrate-binding protein [Xanthomonas sp. WHRI 10064A]|uniref:phosphate ABC transporter substrate-binding protein n=1 Tax=unclassified Xanthomonas TaxID=2643310 RepID=UPI002B23E3B7|nr:MULTISPECIES: phosphate ABC transporter substrate-binding protein [unclassified Xanthomonas]MEA9587370.1 phosphate ABC transporter substrate-binding protein [Xanthomonas sp. WHRI 10064B]MEA9616562.1 phosphate ABC transporter substrate-binding protein [Xanthomonas sp. WHRI 10064A]